AFAVFNNLPSGSFTADGSNNFSMSFFNNMGRFTKLAGPTADGVSIFGFTTFINSGEVTIAPGGTLQFIAGSYTQSAGRTIVDNGTLTSESPIAINGGSFEGSGTINADVRNAGQVSPGLPVGILTINGNYTQVSSGDLRIEIGGTNPGSEFDQLKVNGAVVLDGTLGLSFLNGFAPGAADTFPIILDDDADAISNTFNGVPEGSTVSAAFSRMHITYVGGTGNDLVLK